MALRWTVPLQRRAVEVELCCVRARGFLAAAAESLAPPMPVADAPADVRARLELVRGMLTGASDGLALAACSMEAAELFAVRAAAANPIRPFPSVQHITDGDHPAAAAAARLALILFQSARPCTEQACTCVEWCRAHLRTAESLLAVPALPGVDGILDGEHFNALHDAVEAALNLTKFGAVLAITAHWLVR
ncbi:unnamed protein product [Urochloa decumbens]|uniref:Uncharacterized protein n=1 Tax=Urochloa decumbens TaxID=240449 RepID=A0ABC8Z9Z3_9POAL